MFPKLFGTNLALEKTAVSSDLLWVSTGLDDWILLRPQSCSCENDDPWSSLEAEPG